MDLMTQLEHMRHQMIEELTQIPQYRALKTMERFIAELSTIYDPPPEALPMEPAAVEKKITHAIEKHIRAESPLIMKNAVHMPGQRVA